MTDEPDCESGYPAPGPQYPTAQSVMNHVFFLSREGWQKAARDNRYDHVVVGTGFCALAFVKRTLDHNPFSRILMIERGQFFLPEHFQNLPMPFKSTIGGFSETYPWTVAATTAMGLDGDVRWLHGMVPFFGGKSTLWSAWCPRPTDEELDGWPPEIIAAARRNFESAERLLRVQAADQIDSDKSGSELKAVYKTRPVYGRLQRKVQSMLTERKHAVEGIYRTEAASLASASSDVTGIDFQKFSIPGELLDLVERQARRYSEGTGSRLDIVTDCLVKRIFQQEVEGSFMATALETSMGVLPLREANLVLAMGTLPPTTLLRNSFPAQVGVGDRFSAHFISSIVARVPKRDLDPAENFSGLELGACYIAGVSGEDYKKQYHIQLSALWDDDPVKNSSKALRYMPDVFATASLQQLTTSKDYVVFACAVLGEIGHDNPDAWFQKNPQDADVTTNSLLRVKLTNADMATWDSMDDATFNILEQALSPGGAERVEYWHGSPESGEWSIKRPEAKDRRVPALVHESSTLFIGADSKAPVDLDYRLRSTSNVYVTGGGLWPQAGSWNPTLMMVALSQDLADSLSSRQSDK